MFDARKSETKRKSDLDVRKKFNQVFSDFMKDEFHEGESYRSEIEWKHG